MGQRRWKLLLGCIAISCAAGTMVAQASGQALSDSSRIAPDGTAYVTRVIPVPSTVSPQAQKMLARIVSDAVVDQTLQQWRTGTDTWQNGAGKASKKIYRANVVEDKIAGVPVRIVTPVTPSPGKQDRMLMNLHGGGFNSDSGSLTESIPIANLTGTKVVSVLYRLAPEHPFQAGLDDAIAFYRELLKRYKPGKIGIYGTSAGAILTAEVTVKLKQLKLPMPGATRFAGGVGWKSKVVRQAGVCSRFGQDHY